MRILKFLENSEKKVLFTWVKGHAGVYGIEIADLLAKDTPEIIHTTLQQFFLLQPSFLTKKVKKMLEKLQYEWNIGITGRYTFNLLPKVSEHCFLRHNDLYFFLTNHGPYSNYLFKFKSTISPL